MKWKILIVTIAVLAVLAIFIVPVQSCHEEESSYTRTYNFFPWFYDPDYVVRHVQSNIQDYRAPIKWDCCIRYREVSSERELAEEFIIPCAKDNGICKDVKYSAWKFTPHEMLKLESTIYTLIRYNFRDYKEFKEFECLANEIEIETKTVKVKVKFTNESNEEISWKQDELLEGHQMTQLTHYAIQAFYSKAPESTVINHKGNTYLKLRIMEAFEHSDTYLKGRFAHALYALWDDVTVLQSSGNSYLKEDIINLILKDDIPADKKRELIFGSLKQLNDSGDIVNTVDLLYAMSATKSISMKSKESLAIINELNRKLESNPSNMNPSLIKQCKKRLEVIAVSTSSLDEI